MPCNSLIWSYSQNFLHLSIIHTPSTKPLKLLVTGSLTLCGESITMNPRPWWNRDSALHFCMPNRLLGDPLPGRIRDCAPCRRKGFTSIHNARLNWIQRGFHFRSLSILSFSSSQIESYSSCSQRPFDQNIRPITTSQPLAYLRIPRNREPNKSTTFLFD